jgi:2-keto-4-pentenoate hydratase
MPFTPVRNSMLERAADQLATARLSGVPLGELAPGARPASKDDALEIQRLVACRLGETVAGWKVGIPGGDLLRGAIYASTVVASGGSLPPTVQRVVGYEGELAFRFERDLPAREAAYSRSEVTEAVSIMPAIEIVGTRFRDPAAVGALDRLADNNLNGGFVAGPTVRHWNSTDLLNAPVTFSVDGVVVISKTGGHPDHDPFAPALALANALRATSGVAAGQFMTTGAPTGCIPVERGHTIVVTFLDIGSVSLVLPKI